MPLAYGHIAAPGTPPTDSRSYGRSGGEHNRPQRKATLHTGRQPFAMRCTSFHHLPAGFLLEFSFKYLHRRDREALGLVDHQLHRTLDTFLAEEQIRMRIPLTVSLTGVHRLLRRVPAALPTCRVMLMKLLAESLPSLPTSHLLPAAEAILSSLDGPKGKSDGKVVTEINEEHLAARAVLIGTMARALCPIVIGLGYPAEGKLPLEEFLWKQAGALPARYRGEPLSILLEQGAENLMERQDVSRWLAEVRSLPLDGRSALLRGLAMSRRSVKDYYPLGQATAEGVEVWKRLFAAALELPPGFSEQPLEQLTAKAGAFLRGDSGIWGYLLEVARTRQPSEQSAIYGGMANLLPVMPYPQLKAAFDVLWNRAMALPSRHWPQILDRFANAAVTSACSLYRYADIVDKSLALPASERRLDPIKTILCNCRGRFSDIRDSVCGYVVSHMDALSTLERAELLGDCAACVNTTDALRPIVAAARSLPSDLQHWTAAGLAANPVIARPAGGSSWIDEVVMPMIVESRIDDRADALLELARHAFRDYCGTVRTSADLKISPKSWSLINQYFDALPSTLQADALRQFIGGLDFTETPAWKWAMTRTLALPRGYQPKLIHALLSRPDMLGQAGKVTAVHRLLPAIFALPPFYRALPYKAVRRAISEVHGWNNISGYWCAVFHAIRLKASLPSADNRD